MKTRQQSCGISGRRAAWAALWLAGAAVIGAQTVYVAATGNDTEGDGKAGKPYS